MGEQLRQLLEQMLLQRPQWVPENGLLDANRGRIRGRLDGIINLIRNMLLTTWRDYPGSREEFTDEVNAIVNQFIQERDAEILLWQGQRRREGDVDFDQMLLREFINRINRIIDDLPARTWGEWFWDFFSDDGNIEGEAGGPQGFVRLEHDFGRLVAHYRAPEGGMEYILRVSWGYLPGKFNVGETISFPLTIEREWIEKPVLKREAGHVLVETSFSPAQVYSEEGNYLFNFDAPGGDERDKIRIKVSVVPFDSNHCYRWFQLEYMLWKNTPMPKSPIGTNPRVDV